jgi:hypothetical protein
MNDWISILNFLQIVVYQIKGSILYICICTLNSESWNYSYHDTQLLARWSNSWADCQNCPWSTLCHNLCYTTIIIGIYYTINWQILLVGLPLYVARRELRNDGRWLHDICLGESQLEVDLILHKQVERYIICILVNISSPLVLNHDHLKSSCITFCEMCMLHTWHKWKVYHAYKSGI